MFSKFNKYNIILASGSPRRKQFLQDLDIPFQVITKEIEEIYPQHLERDEITNFLANLKAAAFDDLAENDVVITSDTIVWFQNKALGKPKDFDDAFEMLSKMAGHTHEVYTSVCIKTKNKIFTFSDCTKVTFSNLTNEEITYYLNLYKPFDKAGSYGIQDWIGLVAISKIEGSYTNVVGLPTEKLFQKLNETLV